MISIRKTCLLIVFFIGCILPAKAQPAATIPEFTVYRLDKSTFTNKDLNTDRLLFFLFFDVKCEHCQQATLALSKNYNSLKNIDIHMITLDLPADVDQFLKKYGKNLIGKSNVTVLYDVKNEFIIKFKPKKYPSIFLYSPQKKLILYDDNPEKLPTFFKSIKDYPIH